MSKQVAPGLRELVLFGQEPSAHARPAHGERLEQLFEEICDRIPAPGRTDALAVDAGATALRFDELDSRANQLARYLLAHGARPGDRIGLLFDEPVASYLGMLAVLKIHAAYVPLDVGFPAERMAYIAGDAGVRLVLSLRSVRERLGGLEQLGARVLCVDSDEALVAAQHPGRLYDAERGAPVDELAYIIYTSGSTGKPKGVAIDHASICNFVRVAASVYGISARDRVYQGMTIAFDFSVEEIWVPWMAGATLVPKPAGTTLLGHELHEFLSTRRVTALCCVPTLLATLEEDLPRLGFLLVSGEACPQDLVNRWHAPGRVMLNVYGPTEATVTATWTHLTPGHPVTIGVPLPTYAVVVLDPDDPYRALPRGEVGELGIAGVGLAREYLHRPELTERVFIPDFLGIPDNPSGRIYRTGDLGRINPDGEIEYHGRVDLQVKIRGYRIELTEIESVLLGVPGIAAAVVDTHTHASGNTELVGYYSTRRDAEPVESEAIYPALRAQLPAYMVPTYLEHLDAIPMTTSDKVDRRRLPAPSRRRAAPGEQHVEPRGSTEERLARALAETLHVDQVSVESHFFDELGASSLLMAQFSARVRGDRTLARITMRDIYMHPTVRRLAAAIGDPAATSEPPVIAAPAPAVGEVAVWEFPVPEASAWEASVPGAPVREAPVPPAPDSRAPAPDSRAPASDSRARATDRDYLVCGAVQLLLFLCASAALGLVLDWGYRWVSATTGLELCGRAAVLSTALFTGVCVLPIAAKWLLVGRWKPTTIRIWSAGYLRFWLVKTLIQVNPMVLFAGSPLYNIYLRALGVKIGRDAVVFSRTVPVATDLITIGPRAVIRRDSVFTGYRAVAGVLELDRVTVGAEALVGEKTVLDVGTCLGDYAQLGHSSSLQTGQAVPAGASWHGSPAEPAGVNYRTVPVQPGELVHKIWYSLWQLLGVFLVGPVVTTVLVIVETETSEMIGLLGDGPAFLGSFGFYWTVAVTAVVVSLIGLAAVVGLALTLPRVLARYVVPGQTYPLYGLAYILQEMVTLLTNFPFLVLLLGDSSFIVGLVRGLGYHVTPVEQTGSNFGTQLRQDAPHLTTVGTGSMVCDGLSIVNVDYSYTSFQVNPVTIGERNFIGNDVVFPAGARTGRDCLVATKAMIPLDGPIREGVGLLGSPPFEIPRSTRRPEGIDSSFPRTEFLRLIQLSAKERYNARTILRVLLARLVGVVIVLLLSAIADGLWSQFGFVAIAAALVTIPVALIVYSAILERAVLNFQPLIPRHCTIYDPYFWFHERLWKFYTNPILHGTPFQNVVSRLAGLRIGRRVFDDGCAIPEKTLVAVGDDAILNAGSVIQCHSLEDGYFQSGYTVIGSAVTVGVKAFVHYGATIGAGSVLGADSFLMKGEQIAPHSHWVGNPAGELPPNHSFDQSELGRKIGCQA